jgi:hypothetical protein
VNKRLSASPLTVLLVLELVGAPGAFIVLVVLHVLQARAAQAEGALARDKAVWIFCHLITAHVAHGNLVRVTVCFALQKSRRRAFRE